MLNEKYCLADVKEQKFKKSWLNSTESQQKCVLDI